MSSAELKKVSGANPLIEEASRELTDLLAGRISDTKVVASRDRAIRQFVATEVLAATAAPDAEIQQRARQAFVEYGYLDEVIHDLRNAQADERIAAARILGEFGSDLATPALVEALLDSEPAVRSAAAAALIQSGEPPTAFERTPHLQQPPRGSAHFLFPDQVKSDPPTSESQRHTASEQSAVLYSANDQSDGADLQSLFLKDNALGKALEEMEHRLLEVTSALTEANKEIHLRAEAALKFKSEATTLRQREEECRKQAEEATTLHETEIELKAQAEQARQTLTEEVTLLRVDVERSSEAILKLSRRRAQSAAARRSEAENARRQADEIYNVELGRLRSEEIALRQAAEKTAMRRAEVQQARRGIEKESLLLLEQQSGALPEASRLAEAERLHRQAEERHRAEQEQLRIQIDKLSRVADEVAARKASIEVATKNAEAEAEELAEAYARMQAAEEIRRQTEIERARLEEQILSSVKEEGHLLEETRARLPEEHRIDEFGIERLSQNESRQLADFEEFRGQQELEARKRSVIEQQILSEIERMAEAEADARRRIEHADLRRRAAEDACRQVEEKARKVEAEARRRVIEEEQALAKLETIRLDADAAVQARAEQERRIKEEIEQLRRLAEEAGLRIGAETRRRAQAEARLHEERQRLSVEESDRLKVERQHHLLVEQAFPATEEDESFWRDEPGENLRRIESPPVPGDK